MLLLSFGFSLSFCRSFRVLVPRVGDSVLCPFLNLVVYFLGVTQFRWSLAVFPPPPFVCPRFVSGALSVVFWFVGAGPLVLCGVLGLTVM